MKLIYTFFIIVIFLFSCTNQKHYPEKISKKIPINELGLIENGNNTVLTQLETSIDFDKLLLFVRQFESKDDGFDLEKFENKWVEFAGNKDVKTWNKADVKTWIEITGLLLELTSETRYGEELERISNKENGMNPYIVPYVLTKKLDNIYVNLFQPVEINYKHSMKGEVTFRQETDYPKSGSVRLYFGMTERRYIELFIRIPSWAEGTHVNVKGVKYFADPGSYCKILKKWKEGDVVDIEFPINKKPQ